MSNALVEYAKTELKWLTNELQYGNSNVPAYGWERSHRFHAIQAAMAAVEMLEVLLEARAAK